MIENKGKKTPGGDGERWETSEQKAVAVARIGQWQRYRPRPLKRIAIPKKNGQQRRLSTPTVWDRIIQQAIARVLGPIFDPEFSALSFGFRPGRSPTRR